MGISFYDISLVDGYNLPIGIISLHTESSDPALASIPPNTTNPICIGSPNLLDQSEEVMNMTIGGQTYNLPLDRRASPHQVERWCPWPLQLQPPWKPGAGVYPYPDDNIKRPAFDPCLSACSKYGKPSDCCTGKYDSPTTCKPSLYSRAAKAICPDAYSYGAHMQPPPLNQYKTMQKAKAILTQVYVIYSIRRPHLHLHNQIRRRLRGGLLPVRPLHHHPPDRGGSGLHGSRRGATGHTHFLTAQ